MCLADEVTSGVKGPRQTMMTRTEAVSQVGSARNRRERAVSKDTTTGTRTDSEAAHAGEYATNYEAQSSSGGVRGRVWWHVSKVTSLTQGDLLGESPVEVSRGHSSDETGRKIGGAKDQRTKEIMLKKNLFETLREGLETTGRHNFGDEPGSTKARRSGSSRSERAESAPKTDQTRDSLQKS